MVQLQAIAFFDKITKKNILEGDCMPIYGYLCKTCNHSFEVMQSINDKPIKKCPECGNEVSKVFFPVGITFKGAGFYTTDYKAKTATGKEEAVRGNGENGCNVDKNDGQCISCPSTTTLGSD